jgi:hypothetical protein
MAVHARFSVRERVIRYWVHSHNHALELMKAMAGLRGESRMK